MLIQNDKIYRNLQEQVLHNQDQIEILKSQGKIADLGIKIIQPNPLPNVSSLPSNYTGDYGDAYLVGASTPYDLYIWTRSNNTSVSGYWFNWGPLNAPSTIPGPDGPEGPTGPQGTRGSLWYSQTGAPGNISGANNNDQYLDGSNGDIYQLVTGVWQFTGNIRGPQGIQGIPGIQGIQGIQGPVGPPGPAGNNGEPFRIVAELEGTNQLPPPTEVPLNTAYMIPAEDGTQHIWFIIGNGTTAEPYLWHDGGSFGSGTVITIDGAKQANLDLSYVSKTPYTYEIGDNTQVSSNGSEVTFSNLQAVGTDMSGDPIDSTASIELPISSSENIEWKVQTNTLTPDLTESFWNTIDDKVGDAKPQEVQINAPTTATNGILPEEDLAELMNNKGAYLMFNDEIYRLQDVQHIQGYLVYTHIGYNNNLSEYTVKCITVTVSTRSWVLTTKVIENQDTEAMHYEVVSSLPSTANGEINKIYLLVEVID